tara:strand:+ start:132360 stop:134135 length:1776 start_codon:yes stop_codon:yes gene_type:complete
MGFGSVAIAELNFDVSGQVRQEAAYKITSDENIWNQQGNTFNGKGVDSNVSNDVLLRPNDFGEDNDWNLMATRAEIDISIAISDSWSGFIRARGYFEYGAAYNDFGSPSYMETPFFGDCGTRLEVCGKDYMLDLPAAYLDYNDAGLWLRIGNQQIAWGEALFFRVADVANGLDLRRHSFIDYASEEYADERIASPAVRGSYRLTEEWELEGFAQMFNPSIIPNENTPYNVVASQFVLHQREGFNEVDNDWNFGLRLKAQIDDLGLQFFAVNRRNPDGAVGWRESNIDPFADSDDPNLRQLGELLSQTAFEMSPEGVYSAGEWFPYAGGSRVDGVKAIDALVNEFPAAQALGAFPITGDPTGNCAALGFPGKANERACAEYELDSFFDGGAGGLGPLRGHLTREYARENIFGWGMNYLFFAEPDSLLDQLVMRFEMSYTPDKEFSGVDLTRDFVERDEYVASVVFEKYQRFSASFPATFMVFEYMYKSESDMFGRLVDGSDNNGQAKGINSFNAVAFAVQQPSPTLEWRFDMSILYDIEGGVFVQPAIRWKPDSSFTVDAFVNYFHSDGGNKDIMQTIEWADEVGVRLTYQF